MARSLGFGRNYTTEICTISLLIHYTKGTKLTGLRASPSKQTSVLPSLHFNCSFNRPIATNVANRELCSFNFPSQYYFSIVHTYFYMLEADLPVSVAVFPTYFVKQIVNATRREFTSVCLQAAFTIRMYFQSSLAATN